MRVALIFSNELRPETTGTYCRRALASLVDVEHFWPDELNCIPRDWFDLHVFIDDGLDYPIPSHLRPSAAWAIDTHVDFHRTLERFGRADLLFAAQKNGAGKLQTVLGRSVTWLPLACDPVIHRPVTDVKEYDIGFVGHFIGERRLKLLQCLKDVFPNSRFCQTALRDMASVYSASRIGFNCGIADDINMRVFEVLAHGIPLLTNNISDNGLEELFDPGTHLLTFDDDSEVVGLAAQLLQDKALRMRLAVAGRDLVLSKHTYRHRMLKILKAFDRFGRSNRVMNSINKSPYYFEFSRPDVQDLVPAGTSRVLDIGCGGGRLGCDLKQKGIGYVCGIEPNLQAVNSARTRLDVVHATSIQDAPDDLFEAGEFDIIIFADVLEHLRNPLEALQKASRWLASDGQLIVSIPNSRHQSVITGLLKGNWTYEPAGLLDEDHVRCFTRREIEKLLYRAGFAVNATISIPGSGHEDWVQSGKQTRVRFGNCVVDGLAESEVEEFFVYQYILRAERSREVKRGLTSIVIVAWNQLPFTQECVQSVQLRTDMPFEFVFVDNGSTDGTSEYLSTIPNSTLICNSENRGFAPAVNQALLRCKGKQIVLLNNDCVVTTGWLDRMLQVLFDDERNGIVGPLSNNVSGPQQIPVSYTDLTSLDGFAWDMRKSLAVVETDRLVGFCMLFRRKLVEEIGLLDERFEIGCFEDDDFCKRAQAAGYRLLIATNSFVHHYGSQTFKAAGIDFEEVMSVNHAKYQQKWSIACDTQTVSGSDGSENDIYEPIVGSLSDTRLQRKTKKLSLCMIVRNNEESIEACLDSIYPWVDELIVVDTGSQDRTSEICRQFTSRLYQFPWCDDFSAARNESLAHARGEWVFWMDSDDIVPEEQGRKIRALAYGEHETGVEGYVMQVRCPSGTDEGTTLVDHVKLFRNRPEFRFEHRIHEQILPSIRRFGGEVAFTDIHIVHAGAKQDSATRQRKLERDFRILELEHTEHPDHPFVLFNLGMTHEDVGNYSAAETYLRRAIELAQPAESHLRKAWALLINCQRLRGDLGQARASCTEALQLFPDDPELLFRQASLLQELDEHDAAIAVYLRILNSSQSRVFQSMDPGICGYKARHNLALSLAKTNRTEEAILQWRKALLENPEFSSGWESLGRELIAAKRATELQELLSSIANNQALESTSALLKACESEAEGKIEFAISILKSYTSRSSCRNCLDELCRLQTLHGYHGDAIVSLERLLEIKPNDAATHHNLGVALLLAGRPERSMAALKKAVEIDPSRLSTTLYLADIMSKVGAVNGAVGLLEECLTHHPENQQISEAIDRLKKTLDEK